MKGTRHHSSQIASGIGWIIVFVGLGKLVGGVKEIVLASRYGVSDIIDSFVIVSTLVAFPVGVWFSAVQAIVIPADLRATAIGQTALDCFRAECLALTLVLGSFFAVFMMLGAPYLIQFLAGSDESARLAVAIAPQLAWLALPGMLGSLASGWIMANGRYINSLLEGVPALVLAIVVYFASDASMQVLVTGAIIGTLMHTVTALFLSAKTNGVWLPQFSLKSQQWFGLRSAALLTLLGQGVLSAVILVEQFILAWVGEGAIATFSFASRLIALVVGIGALAVNRATLPVFSELIAGGRTIEAKVIARRWMARLFVIGSITIPILWISSSYIVSILFERGKFTTEDTQAVAAALQWMAPQLPFYFAGLVLAALAAASGEYFVLFISCLIGFIVRSVSAWLGGEISGINGVALAATFAYGSTFLYLNWKLFGLMKIKVP